MKRDRKTGYAIDITVTYWDARKNPLPRTMRWSTYLGSFAGTSKQAHARYLKVCEEAERVRRVK